MILYKYLTYEVGYSILENNSIAFSSPESFNDPFESEAACSFFPGKAKINLSTQKKIRDAAVQQFKKSYGVLSLTRQPLNPLMWSHYAGEHTGMVIGIDVSEECFTSEIENTIPVQFGNVIYTHTKPSNLFLDTLSEKLNITQSFSFDRDHIETYQRAFLYKASCWSYEEEVRIVKSIPLPLNPEKFITLKSGNFKIINAFSRCNLIDLPLFLMPKGVIKEVYIGLRSGIHDAEYNAELSLEIVNTIRSSQPQTAIFGCKIKENTWELDRFDLEKEALRQLGET
ncbi:DUF2971 domain-containing protein [Vreelandella populi]|nr:DUF2971 domain-containing protein [Halomonas populi]